MEAQATFSCTFTQSDLDPGCGTAQPVLVAGPEVAAPGAARSVCPDPRRGSSQSRTLPGNMASAANSSISKPTLPKMH